MPAKPSINQNYSSCNLARANLMTLGSMTDLRINPAPRRLADRHDLDQENSAALKIALLVLGLIALTLAS
jgi:hypothetical protein